MLTGFNSTRLPNTSGPQRRLCSQKRRASPRTGGEREGALWCTSPVPGTLSGSCPFLRRRALMAGLRCLVLNASMEPISVVSAQRGLVLLLKERAMMLERTQAGLPYHTHKTLAHRIQHTKRKYYFLLASLGARAHFRQTVPSCKY